MGQIARSASKLRRHNELGDLDVSDVSRCGTRKRGTCEQGTLLNMLRYRNPSREILEAKTL